MNKQTFISLTSLAMDLKRVALGDYRGSYGMAYRFLTEAIKRKNEIDAALVEPYVRNILRSIEQLTKEKDAQKRAEDALMYSTLLQNYSFKKFAKQIM